MSCEMLYVPLKKQGKGLTVLYLNQDIMSLNLWNSRCRIMLNGYINYITDKRKVKDFFKLVANYLNPGGIFDFDINSEYKLENVLGNNVLYEVGKEITYIWVNRYSRKSRICEFDLTFFVENQGKYDRFDELHYERAYSVMELEKIISSVKCLEIMGIYDQFSFTKPKEDSERIFFVCRKSC